MSSQHDVDAYLKEWLENINDAIFLKNNDHSIENYPDIKNAFEIMKKAWLEAFMNNDSLHYVEKAHKRDDAIQELGKCIAKAGINHPAA